MEWWGPQDLVCRPLQRERSFHFWPWICGCFFRQGLRWSTRPVVSRVLRRSAACLRPSSSLQQGIGGEEWKLSLPVRPRLGRTVHGRSLRRPLQETLQGGICVGIWTWQFLLLPNHAARVRRIRGARNKTRARVCR
ncbi:hypothetical protein TNIN_270091 [Trichonephila inaurata madagascariensis]|uniref:Uncharacterized protein n=1 Tax=Trichonephila inaurata madagascariensis TaxID=2747483 RepID=A0A8X6XZ82_9ARAC|nr:hypothetical protein TNIN_270091 [Trichonephila inaurata madagascariensis]